MLGFFGSRLRDWNRSDSTWFSLLRVTLNEWWWVDFLAEHSKMMLISNTCFNRQKKVKNSMVPKLVMLSEPRKFKRITFHYTGWLLGILIMVYQIIPIYLGRTSSPIYPYQPGFMWLSPFPHRQHHPPPLCICPARTLQESSAPWRGGALAWGGSPSLGYGKMVG